LEVAATQIGVDTRLLELIRLRYGRGLASDREVAQAEALLKGARAVLPPLRVGLEGQLNRLDVLMIANTVPSRVVQERIPFLPRDPQATPMRPRRSAPHWISR
jgi:outer membrane protein TolC